MSDAEVARETSQIVGRIPDDSSTGFTLQPDDDTSLAWQHLSDQAERFTHAWKEFSEPPFIGDFLPVEPLSLRRLTLIELIKLDLEYRWNCGLRKLLSDYVVEFPELEGNLSADLIYEEYHIRNQAGELVSWESYLATYPRQAEELRHLFGGRGAATVSMKLFGLERGVPGSRVKPGDAFDDFRILAHLGQGAFATVFLARQFSMQRRVALKITSPRGEEHATLAQFDHPNIVRIFDQRLLADRGWRLLYMEYLPGGTLRHVVDFVKQRPPQNRTGQLLFQMIDAQLAARQEPLSIEAPLRERFESATWPEVVCWLGSRLARGLAHAHRAGVLHRDLKPANILLTAEGNPKLADFNVSFNAKSTSLVAESFFGGSLAYMSPEQLEAYNPAHPREADTLDGRSDLFSLGVTLWELLVGHRPFPADAFDGDWARVLHRMTAVRREGLSPGLLHEHSRFWPPGLAQVLRRLLSPEAGDRYPTGLELSRQLDLCLEPGTMQLLTPHPHEWRSILRRRGVIALLVLAVLPNLVVAVFNGFVNRDRIVDGLAGQQLGGAIVAYTLIQLLAFPLAAVVLAWRSWPVLRSMQRPLPAVGSSGSPVRSVRSRCLGMGTDAATTSLGTWLLVAVVCPLVIWLNGPHRDPPFEFSASLFLCGLIAVAYSFFGIAWLSASVFYPALVELQRLTREDRQELRSLRRWSWFFLLLAAFVPFASVAILAMLGTSRGTALILLAGGGVLGLGMALLIFRALQRDLQTLLLIAAPSSDSQDSSTDAGSWLFREM
ncbi:MAG: serine/threonine-protein kinase [Planctomycetaceae bacterium]